MLIEPASLRPNADVPVVITSASRRAGWSSRRLLGWLVGSGLTFLAGLVSSRLALRAALGVALDVLLTGAGHAEPARRHVLGDHRSRRRVGIVADAHRSDQRRVDTGLDPVADRGPVLAIAVVVGGDRAGPEVRTLADVGVADVAQMRHLAAGAHVGVLDLHERARLGARAQH